MKYTTDHESIVKAVNAAFDKNPGMVLGMDCIAALAAMHMDVRPETFHRDWKAIVKYIKDTPSDFHIINNMDVRRVQNK